MSIGNVVALYRYPVKAMAGQSLEAADVGWHGIAGDRRHAFVRGDFDGGFPWLTIRQVPALTTYVPLGDDGAVVRTPGGRELELGSDALRDELAAAYGGPVHLHHDQRGTQDAFPVSVMSVQTVRRLGELAGRELEPLRFRPSIVVDLPGRGEFPEEALVGSAVTLGDVRVRLNLKDERCMVINFDPHTAERDPAVLRTVAQQNGQCLGVYGSCEAPGVVRVGDPISLATS